MDRPRANHLRHGIKRQSTECRGECSRRIYLCSGERNCLKRGRHDAVGDFHLTDTVDYSSATSTVTLVVSPAALTVTTANANRPFGQANPAFTGTVTGITNGDNITVTYSCGATTNSSTGDYPIIPALVDPNDRQTNYTVSLVNGTLTVEPLTLIVTWTNPAPITYGAALTSNQLNATANVPGSFADLPTNGAVLDTGTNTLCAVFTPSDTVNYNGATNTVSLIVSPAPLTVTADSQTRTYGQANPSFTGSITGVTNADNITASYGCSATTNSPVGDHMPSRQRWWIPMIVKLTML